MVVRKLTFDLVNEELTYSSSCTIEVTTEFGHQGATVTLSDTVGVVSNRDSSSLHFVDTFGYGTTRNTESEVSFAQAIETTIV
jgi:hypothetical protein